MDTLYVHLLDTPHAHHFPSILLAHMAYPLIAISRSNLSYRLCNNLFTYTIIRKLRLSLWNQVDLPTCWCDKLHACWEDHTFSCVANRKLGVHNTLVQGTATAL